MLFKKFFLFLLPNMWYPLNDIKSLNEIQINKCKLFGKDYIVYKNKKFYMDLS